MRIKIPNVVYGALRVEVERDMGLSDVFKRGTSLNGNGGLLRPTDAYPTVQAKWDKFFEQKWVELGTGAYWDWVGVAVPQPVPQPNPQPSIPGFVDRLSELQDPPEKQYPTKPNDLKETNPKDYAGSSKVMFSCLPWRVLHRVALALTEGMFKYGRHNYRGCGVRASVYFDAVVARHISDWWEGVDIDPDSGLHHLDKAIAGLMVVRDSMLCGNFIDDRPPAQPIDFNELNAKHCALREQHKDKNPRHYTIQDEV